MGAPPNKIGVNGRRLAANLVRVRRGTSTYELSRRLAGIGRPIRANGITSIESAGRHVDVDDLVALAVALDTTPNRLLLPAYSQRYDEGRDIVPVVGGVRAAAWDLWSWAAGERPLVTRDEDNQPERDVSGQEEAVFSVENLPHHYTREQVVSPAMLEGHPAIMTAMRDALAQGLTRSQIREYTDRILTRIAVEG